jgi:nicotinamide-nucleotide amidase
VKVGALIIGDEVLNGSVKDAHAQFLGNALSELELDLACVIVAPDDVDAICQHLDYLKANSNFIILCGGLGPTEDDRTRAALANYFQAEIIVDEPQIMKLQQRYPNEWKAHPEDLKVMASVLAGSKPIINSVGLASGMWINSDDCNFVILPGVPTEMQSMFDEEVAPLIRNLTGNIPLKTQVVKTAGIGESALVAVLEPLRKEVSDDVNWAFYPTEGEVLIKLTSKTLAESDLREIGESIRMQCPKYVFALENVSIADVIHELLRANNQEMCIVDHFTGGYLNYLLAASDTGKATIKDSVIVQPLGTSTPTSTLEEQMKILNVSAGIAIFQNRETNDKNYAVTIEIRTFSKAEIQSFSLKRNKQRSMHVAATIALNELRSHLN